MLWSVADPEGIRSNPLLVQIIPFSWGILGQIWQIDQIEPPQQTLSKAKHLFLDPPLLTMLLIIIVY